MGSGKTGSGFQAIKLTINTGTTSSGYDAAGNLTATNRGYHAYCQQQQAWYPLFVAEELHSVAAKGLLDLGSAHK
jgi:hypothetical protein